jgi:hypothetical protein
MLVPPLAFNMAFWGSTAVGGLCMAWRFVQWYRVVAMQPPTELPVATARARRTSLVWLRPLLWLGMVGGFVWAHTLWSHHCDVVLVRDGEHDLAVARRVWLGGDPPYHRADHSYVAEHPSWIVNDSGRVLHLWDLVQGYGGPDEWMVPILPHTQTWCGSVDSIGTDDEPPARLSVPSDYENPDAQPPPFEDWTWLTWGAAVGEGMDE